jgi:hypothetical protein
MYPLPPLRDDDTMAAMFIEKVQTLDDPHVEPTADVLRNLLHDMTTVLEPL